jgi:hypothetical protein
VFRCRELTSIFWEVRERHMSGKPTSSSKWFDLET